LAWQYLAFVFVSSCGVLQAAAAYSGLRGLLFIPRRLPSYGLAIAAVVGAFLWFFTAEERAPAEGWPILEGAQQAGLFAGGAALATLFTLLLTSLLPGRGVRHHRLREEGLEALQDAAYLRLLLHRLLRR